MSETDKLLKFEDVATQLGVSYNTIRMYINEGKLKIVKLGVRSIRIRQSEVNRFLESKNNEPAKP